MVKTAVIGTGGMGRKYVRHILEGRVPSMELTALVARSEKSQQELRELCGEKVLICASEDELYEHSGAFDAIIIATPHLLHPQMALNALRHQKHVLLDKPIGVSVADCEEVKAAAETSEKKFSVIFHQRAYPKYQKIRRMLEDGMIGEISRILLESSRYFRTGHYHKSGAWRSSWNGEGGGALINQGQHILDMWQWLFGMPEEIYAQIGFGKYNSFLVDDEAILTMRYPGQKSGTFILTTGEGTYTDRLEIVGSKGTILLEGDHLTVYTYDKDLREYRASAQVNSREEMTESYMKEEFHTEEDTHPVILENFARSIESGEALMVNGIDALNALELTNAAYLSAWKNAPVALPIDAQEYACLLEEHRKAEAAAQ